MSDLKRFGRRLALPSTRQIRHELLQLLLEDELRKTPKAGPREVVVTLGTDPVTLPV